MHPSFRLIVLINPDAITNLIDRQTTMLQCKSTRSINTVSNNLRNVSPVKAKPCTRRSVANVVRQTIKSYRGRSDKTLRKNNVTRNDTSNRRNLKRLVNDINERDLLRTTGGLVGNAGRVINANALTNAQKLYTEAVRGAGNGIDTTCGHNGSYRSQNASSSGHALRFRLTTEFCHRVGQKVVKRIDYRLTLVVRAPFRLSGPLHSQLHVDRGDNRLIVIGRFASPHVSVIGIEVTESRAGVKL